MSSSSRKRSLNDGLNFIFFTLPQETLLQLSTVPMLAVVLAGKAAAETCQAIGQASEEVFRGDRLPLLKFPDAEKSEVS